MLDQRTPTVLVGSSKKDADEFDVVVLGAGAGGMTTAAVAASKLAGMERRTENGMVQTQ